ncbi:hypothetical protein DEU56DRAFT_778636 [Suillus clintonianus]|uniref:uncharacterized protein n=1 Tax=Suillus clintonianus TaxID=1904413 RepID=UPI001B8817D3|nr:uncharacterized protein DEU56DRAFT_778636 [Suillus clintonianus]KAG2150818.1 hypothetical protein DEU56DRAFT_778636 [Suillus clintonianus]
MALSPLTPPPGPTAGPPVVITTASSSSSGYASTTSTSSSSSSGSGLSTGARAGLAFGIVFFLILLSLLFANLRRRYQRAREKVDDEPALVTSDVSQRLPPQSVASRGRDFPPPPPPRLDTTYPNSPDISSAAPLLSHDSHRNSYPVSAQNRYSTLSQVTDPQRIATQDVPTLPNPHEPFSAPARPASYYSPTYSIPYDASASAAMMAPFNAPAGGSSSNSQPERQLSTLHADMARHQKELELEHKKRSLDEAREQQDPPPRYLS